LAAAGEGARKPLPQQVIDRNHAWAPRDDQELECDPKDVLGPAIGKDEELNHHVIPNRPSADSRDAKPTRSRTENTCSPMVAR
jgi:hypothetical protein